MTNRPRFSVAAAFCSILLYSSLISPPDASAASSSFQYDELGRLVQVVNDNGIVLNYSYDKAGNRTQELVTGSSVLSPERKALLAIILLLLLDD
jgi:YD repeat-containing protein